jgi:hypothetical protein
MHSYKYELIRHDFNKETVNEIKNLILILIFTTVRFNIKENLLCNIQILINAKLFLNMIVFMPSSIGMCSNFT